MWWPFSSNKGKETSEVTEELAPSLRGFFAEKNPDQKHASLFSESPFQQRVNEVLNREEKLQKNQQYSYEFDKYKRTDVPRRVTSINCAEIQQHVIECFKGWSAITDTNHCSKEIQTSRSCVEIQTRALKTMHYDDCYDKKQCDQIRYLVDQLFVKTFGQYGENISDENETKYTKDLERVFYKVWK